MQKSRAVYLGVGLIKELVHFPEKDMTKYPAKPAGTKWIGNDVLWLDLEDVLTYSWIYENKEMH